MDVGRTFEVAFVAIFVLGVATGAGVALAIIGIAKLAGEHVTAGMH